MEGFERQDVSGGIRVDMSGLTSFARRLCRFCLPCALSVNGYDLFELIIPVIGPVV